MYGYVEVTDAYGKIVTGNTVPLELLTDARCVEFAWQQGSPLAQYRIVELASEDEGVAEIEMHDVAPF